MAEDYLGVFGSGYRARVIVSTASGYTFSGTGFTSNNSVDGAFVSNINDSWFFDTQTAGGKWIRWEFLLPVIITGFKWYQNNATANGVHQPQGSNNGTTWDDLGSTINLGGASTVEYAFTNDTPYKYFRLLGVSGNVSFDCWQQETEFKTFYDDYAAGDRTAIIATTTDLTLNGGAGAITALVDGVAGPTATGSPAFAASQAVSGKHLTFMFDDARALEGYLLFSIGAGSAYTSGQGVWQPQYWDGSAWQNHEGTVTLGIGDTVPNNPQLIQFSGPTPSTTGFRFLGVSGTTDADASYTEIQFLITPEPPSESESESGSESFSESESGSESFSESESGSESFSESESGSESFSESESGSESFSESESGSESASEPPVTYRRRVQTCVVVIP